MSEWINDRERAELHKLLDRMIDEKELIGEYCYMSDGRDMSFRRFDLRLSLTEEAVG